VNNLSTIRTGSGDQHRTLLDLGDTRVSVHLDALAREALLGKLRDLLGIRVEDVVAALDDRDCDVLLEDPGVLL
jgi:hypothetical protein